MRVVGGCGGSRWYSGIVGVPVVVVVDGGGGGRLYWRWWWQLATQDMNERRSGALRPVLLGGGGTRGGGKGTCGWSQHPPTPPHPLTPFLPVLLLLRVLVIFIQYHYLYIMLFMCTCFPLPSLPLFYSPFLYRLTLLLLCSGIPDFSSSSPSFFSSFLCFPHSHIHSFNHHCVSP